MNRRVFLQQTSFAAAGVITSKYSSVNRLQDFPVVRINPATRKFKSAAVENIITEVKKNIGNKEIAWMFENCFPNTLDTTVDFEVINGVPDTYVITGDID